MVVCAPWATANDAWRISLANQRADDQAEVGAAILLGHVDHQQALLAGLLDQRRHHARLLMLDLLVRFGTHLALDEGRRRLAACRCCSSVKLLRREKVRLGHRRREKARAGLYGFRLVASIAMPPSARSTHAHLLEPPARSPLAGNATSLELAARRSCLGDGLVAQLRAVAPCRSVVLGSDSRNSKLLRYLVRRQPLAAEGRQLLGRRRARRA